MPISDKIAKKMAVKWSGMAMMPTDKDQIEARVDALRRYARSEDHAKRVSTALAERLTYFPTVAEIVLECENSPDDSQVLEKRKNCQYCMGDGWRTVEGPYGTSAAYPCDHSGEENPSMGVRMAPATQTLYRLNEQAGIERRRKHEEKVGQAPQVISSDDVVRAARGFAGKIAR